MKLIEFINRHILWGVPMTILMIVTGLHLTIAIKGIIFRRFGTVIKCTIGSIFNKEKPAEKGGITPFQAVSTALAGTIGTGNIAGVSAALAVGGPGAVFWMWIPALLGMVTKYSEVTLAAAYRHRNKMGESSGGAMYYISEGLGKHSMAVFFCICGTLCALSLGNMVQISAMTTAAKNSFKIDGYMVGIISAVIAFILLKGGIKRIAGFSEIMVPLMAAFYIMGTIIVIVINRENINNAISLIFKCAFTDTAAKGGFTGASVMLAIRTGIARGVFTNEAGLGSAPTAHAAAETDYPAKQGLWGAFEVFLDTIIMCTLTSLAILSSGVWPYFDCSEPNDLTQSAFAASFNGGEHMVTVCIIIFAFETITAWYYYGEKFIEFLNVSFLKKIYFPLYIAVIIVGSIIPSISVWELADLFNGLMALPNLAALNILAKDVKSHTEEFFSRITGSNQKNAY